MEYEKPVPFKNWSTEDFLGVFGAAVESPMSSAERNHTAELVLSEPYMFKAGATYSVPQSQALHFAKQLAVRELHRLGTPKAEMLADIDVREYMDKCFPSKSKMDAAPNTFERIDVVEDVEAKPAIGIVDANKTIEQEQVEVSDDDEDDVSDEKNNTGAPVFKKAVGRPRKDAQYVK